MTYLGLDLGSKTVGVSISDRTGIIASSLEVIRYTNIEDAISRLKEIVNEKKVDAFVLGNPLNLDGSISKRCEEGQIFKERLEKEFNMKVFLQDERLSTVEAHRMLINNNTRRNNRKKVVDKIAATIILQSFLDRSNHER